MSVSLSDRRRFHTLNVFDDYNQQTLRIELVYRLPLCPGLNELIEIHGKPEHLRIAFVLNSSASYWLIGQCIMASIYDSFNRESLRKMLKSKGLTVLIVLKCFTATFLKHLETFARQCA